MKPSAIVCVILAVTGLVHWGIRHERSRTANEAPPEAILNIPSDVGGYRQSGQDSVIDESVRALLQTNAILMRTYISPQGFPVRLTIVYSTKSRGSLHFPEVCLVGQGWEVREQTPEPVGILFEGKRIVIFKGDQEEAVLYWFKTGDFLTGNFFLNSLEWIKRMVLFSNPTTAMIKISTPVQKQGVEYAVDILKDFATKLTPILMEDLQ